MTDDIASAESPSPPSSLQPEPPSQSYEWKAAPPHPPAWPPPPPGRASRWKLPALIIAGALILGVGIGVPVGLLVRGGSSGATTPPSASPGPTNAAATQAAAVYRQALAAMRGSAGFHYVANSNGAESQQIVGDAGRSNGRQVITFQSAYGAEQFTLLLMGSTVYFQGNTPALEDQLGIAAATAPGLQSQWISVSAGNGPYTVLQPGITVADQAQESALVPTLTTHVTAANGAATTRIEGTVPPQRGAPAGTGYLDVATPSHVPLAYVVRLSAAGVTVTSTTTFSAWGTSPTVTAPSGSVAWSSLGATEPPGGYGNGGNPGATPSPQGAI